MTQGVNIMVANRDKKDRDVSFDNPLPIGIGDGPHADAFGRLRTGHPFGIFDYKQISTNFDYQFNEVVTGAATATFQYNRSSTYLATTTASGDRIIRQSVRYFPYVPGKSQQIVLTGIFGTPDANVNQYIGYGDDLNGLFFTYQGAQFGVLLRSATSGSAVDTFIPQTEWNVDKLDGYGKSQITLDLTKAQIFIIDFQWLGVGRIRFYLDIEGSTYLVHEINNANNSTVVYMKTPTLPVRYEVHNVGVASAATTLEQICCSVASEGGYSIPGLEFSVGNGVTRRNVVTRTPILAIRLKTAFPAGQPNRRTAKFVDVGWNTITNNCFFELVHVHGPSAITATWTDVDNSSGLEFSTDITAVTPTHAHTLQEQTVNAGLAGGGSAGGVEANIINVHSYISQNFDSTNSAMFVVYATSEVSPGGSNVTAHLTFVEFG